MGPIVCFGEVLWDLLPKGAFLGGAPFNVAYHLGRLGQATRIVSAVGADDLGRDAVAAARRYGLDTGGIRTEPSLPTGTVTVSLDPAGQPSYRINEPVAWDAIGAADRETQPPRALVHGSLALRRSPNRDALRSWIDTRPSLRVCDLNLRQPYDDWRTLQEFVHGVDVLKLNDAEAAHILRAEGRMGGARDAAPFLASKFGCSVVCVTLGAAGAIAWEGGRMHEAPAPAVVVRDTIGAGDAFMAALLDGMLRSGPGRDWHRILARACYLGAWVASRDGAQPDYRPEDLSGLSM